MESQFIMFTQLAVPLEFSVTSNACIAIQSVPQLSQELTGAARKRATAITTVVVS